MFHEVNRTRRSDDLNIIQSRMTDDKGEGHCRRARNFAERVTLQGPSAAFSTFSKKYADFVRSLYFVGMLDAGWIYEW